MPDEQSETLAFGFWVYLMTDLIIFATLFATYAVLHNATFGGPDSSIFGLQNAFIETILLLASSFTSSAVMIAAVNNKPKQTIAWLVATFVLGAGFLWLEILEFAKLIAMGYGPSHSAFLSAFFTLVGTHGLHISIGLLWMVVAVFQIKVLGLKRQVVSRLQRFSLFWHFLDVVWIFIFSAVYLLGHI